MTAPADPPARPWEIIRSTLSGVSARVKRDDWNEYVAGAFQPGDFRTPDWEKFSASMRIRPLGSGALTMIHSDPWQISTTNQMLLNRQSARVNVQVCLAGEVTIEHDGASSTLRPGQAAVSDSLRIHRTRADRGAQVLCLTLDRDDLGGALKVVEGPALILSSNEPVAAVTLDIIRRAWKVLPNLDMDQRALLQHRLGQMVAESLAALSPRADRSSSHVLSMIYRAKAVVMRRFGEPEFGPEQLAQTMDISRRYLSSLFRSIEDTPADYILRVRLHAAWDMLTDNSCTLSIAGIAARLGFSNASVFAKAVKSAFKMTPHDIRKFRM